jgi:hypothetical protein
MKPKKGSLCLLLMVSIYTFGQTITQKKLEAFTLKEVIRFEGITLNGDRVFGIYPTRKKAMEVVKDYMIRNKNNKYQLTYKTIYSGTVEVRQGENAFKKFITLCPKGYKLISKEEYNALVIMNTDKLDAAIWYYLKTKNIKEEVAKTHLKKLYSTYRKYVIQ